jgi:hypothetical protein
MREDAIAAKANAAIGKALRGMIRGVMAAYEGKVSPEVHEAEHKALLHQIAEARAVQKATSEEKVERLKCHYERLEGKHGNEPARQAESEPIQQGAGRPARARKRKRAGSR